MTTKNRITLGLPFEKGDSIKFKNAGVDMKWRIVEVCETANFLVVDNGGKPEKLYINKLVEKIEAGLAEILEGK